MRLFQAPLGTCLGSPFFANHSVHGLHFTVYALSSFVGREICRELFVKFLSGKDPLGCFSMLLTVLFFLVPGAAGARLSASARSLRLCPPTSICCTFPRTFAWICCPQLPHHPCKTGCTAQVFAAQGGTRRCLRPLSLEIKLLFVGVATPGRASR